MPKNPSARYAPILTSSSGQALPEMLSMGRAQAEPEARPITSVDPRLMTPCEGKKEGFGLKSYFSCFR